MNKTLEKAFGIPFDIKEITAPSGLPLYMITNRAFYEVSAEDMRFLLVSIPETDRFGIVALGKQLAQYMNVCGVNTAFQFSSLSKAQRDALIARKIPFVCVQEQIYLPFLGIVLSNHFRQQWRGSVDIMAPATQCLYLYLLYRKKKEFVIKKHAAQELGLTQMSITRASKQLLAMKLIQEEAHGKETWIRAVAENRDYYHLAESYLIDPVLRVLTVEKTEDINTFPYAGETALSERSMLSAPVVPVVAAFRNDPRIADLKEVDERWETDKEIIHVQIWKYDPCLFSIDNCVDPVSMAVSLGRIKDERVEGELQEYMEALEW